MHELASSARDLLDVARNAFRRGDAATARTIAAAAGACARATGDLELEIRATALLARAAHWTRDRDAETQFGALAQLEERAGRPIAAARARASIAFMRYEAGDSVAASELLDSIPAGDDGDLDALIEGYRGNVARQIGDLEAARASYLRAIAKAPGHTLTGAIFEMDLAALRLLDGAPRSALKLLGQAEKRAIVSSEDGAGVLGALIAHYTLLAKAMLTPVPEDEFERGPTSFRPLRAWLHEETRGGARTYRLRSARDLEALDLGGTEHGRLTLRILTLESHALVGVASDGSRVDGHDLTSRRALRGILARLIATKDRAASAGELVAAGWPGERMLKSAARNRLHVALFALRRMGVPIANDNGGYRLERAKLQLV